MYSMILNLFLFVLEFGILIPAVDCGGLHHFHIVIIYNTNRQFGHIFLFCMYVCRCCLLFEAWIISEGIMVILMFFGDIMWGLILS